MKKEFLFSVTKKDFEIQSFQSGGKGGQHQNRTNSGVRIIHKESNARGESRNERSQHQNKKIAFRRLLDDKKFKVWVNKRVYEITEGKSLEQKVEETINKDTIQIDVKNEKGKWIPSEITL